MQKPASEPGESSSSARSRPPFDLVHDGVGDAFWPDGLGNPSFMELMSKIYPVFGKSFQSAKPLAQPSGQLFGGTDIIDLGVGHYLTAPREAVAAAIAALNRGETRYAHVPDLYLAVAAKYRDEQHVEIDPDSRIVMTGGARAAMGLTCSALVQRGDVVVIADPEYIGLTHMAAAAGARIVRPPCIRSAGGELAPDVDGLVSAVESGARLLALTNPCNPTGHVWSRTDLERLVKAAERSGAWILCNEIYDKLYFDEHEHCSLTRFVYERIAVICGTAKNYDMTGFGLGWIVTSKAFADLLTDWQFITLGSAPDTPSQYAASAALTPPVRDTHPKMSAALLKSNWRLLRDALTSAGFAAVGRPWAGQFAFPYIGGDDISLSLELLRRFDIRVTPGSVWGPAGQGHLRIALSNPTALQAQGVERLIRGLVSIRRPA